MCPNFRRRLDEVANARGSAKTPPPETGTERADGGAAAGLAAHLGSAGVRACGEGRGAERGSWEDLAARGRLVSPGTGLRLAWVLEAPWHLLRQLRGQRGCEARKDAAHRAGLLPSVSFSALLILEGSSDFPREIPQPPGAAFFADWAVGSSITCPPLKSTPTVQWQLA